MSSNWESKLTPQEVHAYGQFFSAANGGKAAVVNGLEAVTFFARSGIPNEILSDIWETADRDNLGYLTPETFSIALKLIACAQHGHEVSEPILSTVVPLPQFDGFNPNAMSPTNSGNDIITPVEREKYLGIFRAHQPVQGVLDAEKARNIFNKSKLPDEYLAQIWNLADLRNAGNLNQTEFIIAMHYIAKLMDRSITVLPVQLPAKIYGSASGSIQSSPVLRRTSMSPAALVQQRQFTGSSISSIAPLPRPQRSQTESIESLGSIAFSVSNNNTMPTTSTSVWDVTPQAKMQSDIFFNQIDVKRTGAIQGNEAVEFFKKSRLPDTELARVWDLADMEQNGQLTPDEFAVAMYLIQNRIAGKPLPNVLPKSLIPPSKAATSNRVTSPHQPIFQSPPSMTSAAATATITLNNTDSSSKIKAPSVPQEDLLGDFGDNEELTKETNAVNQLQYQIKNVKLTAAQVKSQKENVSNSLEQSRQKKQNIEAKTAEIFDAQKAEEERLVKLQDVIKSEESGWNQIQQEHDAAQKQLDEIQQEVVKTRRTLEQGRADSENLRHRVHDVQEETAGLISQLEKLRIYVNKTATEAAAATNITTTNDSALTNNEPSTKLTFDDVFSPSTSVTSPTVSMTPKVNDDFDAIFAPQPTTAEKRQPPPPPPPSRRTTSVRRREVPQTTKKTRAPPPPPPPAIIATSTAVAAGTNAAIHESDGSEFESTTTSGSESSENETESLQVETAPETPSLPSEAVVPLESEESYSENKDGDQASKTLENTPAEESISKTAPKNDTVPDTPAINEQAWSLDKTVESDTKEGEISVLDNGEVIENKKSETKEFDAKEEDDSVLSKEEPENEEDKVNEPDTKEVLDTASSEKVITEHEDKQQPSNEPVESKESLVVDSNAEEVQAEEQKQEKREIKAESAEEEATSDKTSKETTSTTTTTLSDDLPNVTNASESSITGAPETLQPGDIDNSVSGQEKEPAAQEIAVEPPKEEDRVTSKILADKITSEIEESVSTASVSNQVNSEEIQLEKPLEQNHEELNNESPASPEGGVMASQESLQNQEEKNVPIVSPESPQDDISGEDISANEAPSKLLGSTGASETNLGASTESFVSVDEHPKEVGQGTESEKIDADVKEESAREESNACDELDTVVATAVSTITAATVAAPVIEGTTTTSASKEDNQESSNDTISAKQNQEQIDEATVSKEKEEETIDNEQQEVVESIEQEQQDARDKIKEKDTESGADDEFMSVDGDDTNIQEEKEQKTVENDSINTNNTNMQDNKEEKPIDEQTEPSANHSKEEKEMKALQVDKERAQATTLSSKDTKEEGGATGATNDAYSDGGNDSVTSDKEDRLKGENSTHDDDETPSTIANSESLIMNNDPKEHVEKESLSAHKNETEQGTPTHDIVINEEEEQENPTHEDFDAVFMERPTDKERTSSDGGGESFEIISSTASPNENQQIHPATDEFDTAFASGLQDAKVINDSSFFNQEDFDAAFAEDLSDAKVVQNDDNSNDEKGATITRGNKLSWASNFGGFNFDDDFDTKKHDEWDSIFGGDDGKVGGTEHVGFQDAFSAPSFESDQDHFNNTTNDNNNSNPFEAATTTTALSTEAPSLSAAAAAPTTVEENNNNRVNQQEKGIPNTGNSNLDQLVIMGFDRDLAKEALDRYDQDLEKATNFLLDLAAK
ncbi:hypothetical protein BDA99DRAFT_539835 [Phascolomyces articulosus]|uniref:Uncharacterized protein n=1 Tax=Phascolomyces articulosus TaxID=60185 RepID=A0AAD5PBE3_9FUNG|nr:hypothetical protein BDA99DRAFT_539835 [Phascolomyces articulosus]